jgi:hypothetical protein
MNLSHTKLARLEPPNGGRDRPTLLRGVLVRQAVRSAWASLDDGASELTDWRAPTALGLDTLAEEDEDEDNQEAAEAAWLDNVLSSFDDDEADAHAQASAESAWAETTVSRPEADDFDYDNDVVQAVALPPMSDDMDHLEEADALVVPTINVNVNLAATATDVTVVEVASVDDMDDDEDLYYQDMATSWIELDAYKDDYLYETDVEYEPFSTDRLSMAALSPVDNDDEDDVPVAKNSTPLQAIHRPALARPVVMRTLVSSSPDSNDDSDSEQDTCPDLVTRKHHHHTHNKSPPSNYDSESDDDDECPTPPLMSCELDPSARDTSCVAWNDTTAVNRQHVVLNI